MVAPAIHLPACIWPAGHILLAVISLLSTLAVDAGAAQAALPPEPAGTTTPLSGEPGRSYRFDIPSQSLDLALNRFAELTGRAAVFPADLVAGRLSAQVHGGYTAKEALAHMLQGTGLGVTEIRAAGVSAFVLSLTEEGAAEGSPARVPLNAEPVGIGFGVFVALVQARVWQAICAHTNLAHESFRSLLRFSIDSSGQIFAARLLASTGSAQRDALLLGALRRVRLGQPPPPGLHQPMTLLITPPQADGPPCPGAGIAR